MEHTRNVTAHAPSNVRRTTRTYDADAFHRTCVAVNTLSDVIRARHPKANATQHETLLMDACAQANVPYMARARRQEHYGHV